MSTPAITLVGTLADFMGNPDPGASVLIQLCGYGEGLIRVAGTMVLAGVKVTAVAGSGGAFSTPLWGNDVITPSGTFYAISVLDSAGNTVQCGDYQLNGSGTFDLSTLAAYNPDLVIAPPTGGEPLAAYWTMEANGNPVPVYAGSGYASHSSQALYPSQTDTTLGNIQFAQFDFAGSVEIAIVYTQAAPTSAVVKSIMGGIPVLIEPEISGNTVKFTITSPGQFYIAINGDDFNSLHLWANPLQSNAPNPSGAGVEVLAPGTYSSAVTLGGSNTILYLGPGRYFFAAGIQLAAGQSLYTADGAFLYCQHATTTGYIVKCLQSNTAIYGRGVFDGSLAAAIAIVAAASGFAATVSGTVMSCVTNGAAARLNNFQAGDTVEIGAAGGALAGLNGTTATVLSSGLSSTGLELQLASAAYSGVNYSGTLTLTPLNPPSANLILTSQGISNVSIDGVMVRDSPNLCCKLSDVANVAVNNYKALGWRLNSDGIDFYSCNGATLTNSYIRTYDDAICFKGSGGAGCFNVAVSNVMFFVQKADGLEVGTESTEPVSGIVVDGFYCHANYCTETTGGCLAVRLGQTATFANVVYANGRIDQCNQPAIRIAVETGGSGSISGVTISNVNFVTAPAQTPFATLLGQSPSEGVSGTTLENIVVAGAKLTLGGVSQTYATGTVVTP